MATSFWIVDLLKKLQYGDLIRRRLFTLHYSAYASRAYIQRHGSPRSIEDLERHRIVAFGVTGSAYLGNLNLLLLSPLLPKPMPRHRQIPLLVLNLVPIA